ncbi:hypothetical protein [Thalassorhabdomicrobium marinisediminis]|uniref:DUF423 domain-containing protein n=1 Tax=Thalassorhabdomicrobium marinisediminis TaxID=2170577 RepID=A0A2T7FXQ2_9RHOB|nr:hypothetical protein [Thalassorhabdomicrobium marinisediminis]PVA06944.1 hypothetical protein DC363_07280 [Thalassorhabdomicrobium marinisediminis]
MRSAAGLLGIIGGVIGIFVGLFGYGMVALSNRPEVTGFDLFDNPGFVQLVSLLAPLLLVAGGAMARTRALWAGGALLMGAALFYAAFGFNVATMFPIGFGGVGGLLAIAAGRPDEEKAHF